MKRPKIAIVGAGHVGASTAQCCAAAELGDLVLLDILGQGSIARGKALDLAESAPILGFDCALSGTNDYEATADSDVVVITAGVPRRPGMTRDELLETNTAIVTSVAEQIRRTSPEAVVIVLTNPLDAMTQRVLQVTGFPHYRVLGQAGVLDTARFRTFVGMELGVSPEEVNAMILGGHGDTMVPLLSSATVSGIPIGQLIAPDRLAEIVQRTRDGGAEIISLLKIGAYYAAGAATMHMIEAVVRDKKRLLPCSAYCDEEYGIGGYYVGVPVVLGAEGVERIVEFKMTDEEWTDFQKSVATVKQLIDRMGRLDVCRTVEV